MNALKMKMWKKALIVLGIGASAAYVANKIKEEAEAPQVDAIPVKTVKVARSAIPVSLIMEEDVPLSPVTMEDMDDLQDDEDDDNEAIKEAISEE